MTMPKPSYTTAEKLRIARLTARAARQIVKGGHEDAVKPGTQRELDRIVERAEARGAAEENALRKRLAQARTDAATAKAEMRAASGPERAAARRRMDEHERAARRLESDLRRYQ
ncbi:hypothetical protein [Streptomyces cadmiisoli]|uniref:hypothetical protein n=1 Tax=Streptomyces cadmiisoli TaxID=2184053 RepID=UPI003660114C